MIYHNLKVALRNLLKYKLQTFISVLSIAVGIVTLAFTHAALSRVKFPLIYSQPYYDRTYDVSLSKLHADLDTLATDDAGRDRQQDLPVTPDILRALKRDGGLPGVEQLAIPNGAMYGDMMEWHLCDSTKRRYLLFYTLMDPDYMRLIGFRSALTGQLIKRLEPGEAVISRHMASVVFGEANPVGAVWRETATMHPLPLTIVDVYEDLSTFEGPLSNREIYYCLGDIEGDLCGAQSEGQITYAISIDVVLKEGFTPQQLKQEMDKRLEPFGLEANVKRIEERLHLGQIVMINSLAYLVGSLILLAALIGFLRMEVQLFWMRRRELSLRITHGAKRIQLFALLFAEVALVVGVAVMMAMLMGDWVEHFIYERLPELVESGEFSLRHLPSYSLCIGGGLLLLCSLIICSVLRRICQSTQGLAATMRRSRTHFFRNVMLGLQIIIALVFVCGTFCVARWEVKMMESINLSDHLDTYQNSLLLRAGDAQDAQRLLEEIPHLPSLDKLIAHDATYLCVNEIEETPKAKQLFFGPYQHFYCVTDTALLEYYHLPVRWFKKPSGPVEGILLNDTLYSQLRSAELAANNTLTLKWNSTLHTLPILGTIPGVPYQHARASVLVHPEVFSPDEYLLIPKAGHYQSLLREVTAVLDQLEPNHVPHMVQNFHEAHTEVLMLESSCIAVWILCAISILICAMGIYSTIALDTRSRRKEMAIRKINGAKSRDIYCLFGRLYLLLIVLSLLIAMPVTVIFHRIIFSPEGGLQDASGETPLWACIGGALLVIVMIAAIVLSNVRSLMRTNPSEIIAKE